MSTTSIEWTDRSVNPIRARLRDAAHAGISKGGYGSGVGHYCEKISPGCAHCYSSTSQARFGMPQFPGARKLSPLPVLAARDAVPVRDNVEVFFDESRLREVLTRRTPCMWFWCDQTDIFGSWVPDAWIDQCFAVMALTPQHTHQVLTKRPERMREYFGEDDREVKIIQAADLVREHSVSPNKGYLECPVFQRTSRAFSAIVSGSAPILPLPNVWLGTSVERQQEADERIPHLLRCPAAVRFLSAEPLLGVIDLSRHLEIRMHDLASPSELNIHWVIVGGESGPGARPMHPDWARCLRDQCAGAGVAFFFKQWGEWAPHTLSDRNPWAYAKGHFADWMEPKSWCPNSMTGWSYCKIRGGATTVARVGKKSAGRHLDGREWSEFPVTRPPERRV